MKYKIKHYSNGRILVIEDYPGIDIDIGNQKPEKEESVELTKKQAKKLKKKNKQK